ncbi:MAG TPA: bifunctional adenosylcobinamide kinase/adenosylcobinamide-phosphate guanylyltransferase [Candidatus Acidoferrum sp.]|nr:bifunctional adenosylcobinamide kinase/adenosylcobinamide-phosphate guanylyltransferase [Candidatus Acidoferrum sp.]
MSRPLVIVLGGTRSGKSRFGRERARDLAGDGRVVYVATAVPGDPELDERIALHRRDRPASWRTVDAMPDLAATIRGVAPGDTILLDGLTLWVSWLIGDERPSVETLVDGPIAALRAALREHSGPVVVVSDEVGLGLVPMDLIGRAFRDILGIAHQQLVADSDEAWFMVAGRALALPPGADR